MEGRGGIKNKLYLWGKKAWVFVFFLKKISLLPPAGVDNNPLSHSKNKHLHLEDSNGEHLKHCDPRRLQ